MPILDGSHKTLQNPSLRTKGPSGDANPFRNNILAQQKSDTVVKQGLPHISKLSDGDSPDAGSEEDMTVDDDADLATLAF